MKNYASILKLIALIIAAIAVICLLVANLEAIANSLSELRGKARGSFCRSCACDEDDWDEDEFEEWGN